jgi:hypothetical protein
MFKVSTNNLPLANEQVVQASSNSGSTFQPGNNERIRIVLQPEAIPLLDPLGSYISCDFELTGNPRSQFNFNGGSCLSMVQDLRVSLGGKVVEEINQVPVLVNAFKSYLRDVNGTKKDTVQESSEGIANPLNEKASAGTGSRKVKLCFQLPSGLLRSPQGIPLLATGPMEIEFRLAPAVQVLKLTSWAVGGLQDPVPAAAGTGLYYPLNRPGAVLAGNPIPNVELAQSGYNAVGPVDGDGYYGFNSIDDCPFPVGSIVRLRNISAGNNTYNAVQVSALALQGNGNIRLTLVAVGGGALGNVTTATGANDDVQIGIIGFLNDAGNAQVQVPQGSYQLTNVQFHAQAIQPPPQYLSSLPKKLASGGFSFDVPTYQEVESQNTGLVNATAEIPVFASRALSVMTVPRLQAQVNYNVSLDGDYLRVKEYQHQIGASGRREPNRPVDTSIMDDANRLLPSQEHLRELEKTLQTSGHVNSLKKHQDCFVMGRALSAKGGSMNLAGSGCRLYANYVAAPGALTYHSYVHHIKKVQVDNSGLEVLS